MARFLFSREGRAAVKEHRWHGWRGFTQI